MLFSCLNPHSFIPLQLNNTLNVRPVCRIMRISRATFLNFSCLNRSTVLFPILLQPFPSCLNLLTFTPGQQIRFPLSTISNSPLRVSVSPPSPVFLARDHTSPSFPAPSGPDRDATQVASNASYLYTRLPLIHRRYRCRLVCLPL
jgi:hypothetical protein